MKEKGVRLYIALLLSTLAAILVLPLLFGFSEIVFLIFYGETPNLTKLFQTMLSVMKKCVPFVVLIGIPAFLLLWNLSHVNYLKMRTAGFIFRYNNNNHINKALELGYFGKFSKFFI